MVRDFFIAFYILVSNDAAVSEVLMKYSYSNKTHTEFMRNHFVELISSGKIENILKFMLFLCNLSVNMPKYVLM